MKKIRVALLYGGCSEEHEISLRTAASVMNYLDPNRFEAIPIGIDKQGRWWSGDVPAITQHDLRLTLPNDTQVILNAQVGAEKTTSRGQLIPLRGLNNTP